MRITAYRGEGKTPGAEITEPLLSGEHALLARATAELDAHVLRVDHVDLEIPYTEGLRVGLRVQIHETSRPSWIGRIIGIGVKSDGDTLIQTLTLERPACSR